VSTETPGTPPVTWHSPALLAVVEMILGSQDILSLVESREGDSPTIPWARAVLDAASGEVAAREAAAEQRGAERVRDAIGTVAEALPCWCPTSFIESGIPAEECPRHATGPALVEAARASEVPR
jgi:hypothetical protein